MSICTTQRKRKGPIADGSSFIESVSGESKPQRGEIALYFVDDDETNFHVADAIDQKALRELKKIEGSNLKILTA